MLTRKAAFWIAVAGAGVLGNFAMEVAAQRLPSGSLKQFVAFLHRGPGGSQ